MENVDREILDRMNINSKKTLIITLKEHKGTFFNNPTVQLIYLANKNTLTGRANCKKSTRHHSHLPLCAKSSKSRICFKNPVLLLFYLYSPLTSCKKSKKSLESFLRKLRYQPTNQHTNQISKSLNLG